MANNPTSALQENAEQIKKEIPWKDLSADDKADRCRDITKQWISEVSVQLEEFKREMRAELYQLKAHKHDKDGLAVIEQKLMNGPDLTMMGSNKMSTSSSMGPSAFARKRNFEQEYPGHKVEEDPYF